MYGYRRKKNPSKACVIALQCFKTLIHLCANVLVISSDVHSFLLWSCMTILGTTLGSTLIQIIFCMERYAHIPSLAVRRIPYYIYMHPAKPCIRTIPIHDVTTVTIEGFSVQWVLHRWHLRTYIYACKYYKGSFRH